MKYSFSGPLASFIERHLQLQRSLGFRQRHATYTLAAFDRYLIEHFPMAQQVSRPMLVGFLKTMSHLNNHTQCLRLSQLRQFCRFLFQLDAESYVPGGDLLLRRQQTLSPYLYSLAEVTALMQLAGQLKPVYALRRESCETLIGLLWVTGLRIGEALRLNLEDVDLEQQLLRINEAKHHKSRLVPLSASAALALNSYAELRAQHRYDTQPTAPFFVCLNGQRWKYDTIRNIFGCLVRQLGLRNKQGQPPRLHDLRHSFATRCLAGFYQSGKDPNSYLPVLATYLGHACVTYTALYLHPQPDLLEVAGARLWSHIHQLDDLSVGGAHASY